MLQVYKMTKKIYEKEKKKTLVTL